MSSEGTGFEDALFDLDSQTRKLDVQVFLSDGCGHTYLTLIIYSLIAINGGAAPRRITTTWREVRIEFVLPVPGIVHFRGIQLHMCCTRHQAITVASGSLSMQKTSQRRSEP